MSECSPEAKFPPGCKGQDRPFCIAGKADVNWYFSCTQFCTGLADLAMIKDALNHETPANPWSIKQNFLSPHIPVAAERLLLVLTAAVSSPSRALGMPNCPKILFFQQGGLGVSWARSELSQPGGAVPLPSLLRKQRCSLQKLAIKPPGSLCTWAVTDWIISPIFYCRVPSRCCFQKCGVF